ncbi:MAG TPA: asparagine synthase (glutamine-hydrolyzing) [Tepidisphaeraceae bacterium]|jgi:asparagine synthase (glutamine-hydrolysing)|nr:asparagine synthase (glutamine-hydrolyzing) [Tepidisphaeraceae bacterium]
MCGFAGVIVWDEQYRVSRQTIEKMSARIAHRGPDGSGYYFSPETEITRQRPSISLAHRRLSIIDPDPRANQPFTDHAGRWIVFNGEIYNFRELRKELSNLQPNYEWRTDCDTEVLLLAYVQWRENCLEHFNGMFAFAIWDEPKNRVLLARDRMGQKPLYITMPHCHSDHPALAFSSEIGGLSALDWPTTSINASALADYLRWGYLGKESTIYSGVRKVAAGTWLRFTAGREEGDYYFHPNEIDVSQPRGAGAARKKIIHAVHRQLVSDVPIGCFLSGGVDSSIIVAAARQAGPVRTFSVGFEDARYDETKYARAISSHLGTEHHEFVIHPDAAADLPKLAEVFGEPFADSSALATHYLARETRRHVKVALSGDGGDELFGGYERYRAIQMSRRIERTPMVFRRLLARGAGNSTGHPKSFGSKLRRFLINIDQPPGARYSGYMRFFDDDAIRELLIEQPKFWPDYVRDEFDANAKKTDFVQAAMAADRVTYLPDDLLAKVDRASMLHALEVRSPFMDHELVSFAAGLTTDQLLKGGSKRMLREAFADDLPPWVFKRKKMGFAVPIGDWLRKELRPMLHDHLFATNSFAAGHFKRNVVERIVQDHEDRFVDHSQRLYALLMLELWRRTRI